MKIMKGVDEIKLFCADKIPKINILSKQSPISQGKMLMSAKLNPVLLIVSEKNVGGRTICKSWL